MELTGESWETLGFVAGRGAAPVRGPGAPLPQAAPDELDALAAGALLVPLADAGRLRITGSDRVDFLHGQVANDVRGLPRGGANRSLLLNHKGHALAEMLVLRDGDEIEAVVEDGRVGLVERSLRDHIVFDQVELERPETAGIPLTLQGPEAEGMLRRVFPTMDIPGEGGFTTFEGDRGPVRIVRSRRSGAGGFDILATAGDDFALASALRDGGASAGGRAALDLARVLAGIPSAAREAGDGVLPQESGLEALLSYRKGCYLGQEIMARIEARGRLRRELSGLLLASEPVLGDREILLDDKPVGLLGTVARHPRLGVVALAVLRNDLPAGATLAAGGVEARVSGLPFE